MIIQVVGFKDVGKTTLMEKLVAYVKRLGYAVVTIKHHGHTGEDIKLPADHWIICAILMLERIKVLCKATSILKVSKVLMKCRYGL